MKPTSSILFLLLLFGFALAIAPGLPEALDNYYSWTRLNADKVLDNPSGAHPQPKDVYVNLDTDTLLEDGNNFALPFPDGTLVIKERNDAEQLLVDRIYLMEKRDGVWHYSFFDRQPDGSFSGREMGSENFCSNCHQGAADTDFVFTRYQLRGGRE